MCLLCNVREGSNIFQYQIKSGLITTERKKNPLYSKQKEKKKGKMFSSQFLSVLVTVTKSEADLIFFV